MRSGARLVLGPRSTAPGAHSAEWKVRLRSKAEVQSILTWTDGSAWGYENSTRHHFSHRLRFEAGNFTLLIQAARRQDSGLYVLEVTSKSGVVCRHNFSVSVSGEAPPRPAAPTGPVSPLLTGISAPRPRGAAAAAGAVATPGGGDVPRPADLRGLHGRRRELRLVPRGRAHPGARQPDAAAAAGPGQRPAHVQLQREQRGQLGGRQPAGARGLSRRRAAG